MDRFRHSLHHHVALDDPHKVAMMQLLAALQEKQGDQLAAAADAPIIQAKPVSHAFPITTVSTNYNFDAYILVGFKGGDSSQAPHLIVDSGNTSLIVPRWEDIAAIPGNQANYRVLGQATEPWGCPANVVNGPIQLFDSTGGLFTIEDCTFFACTGDSPIHGDRTANFGAGCIVPWTASPANVLPSLGLTLQPVLSQTDFPYVEFDYAPMEPVQDAGATASAHVNSMIRIHSVVHDGFFLLDIVRDCPWMSLIPIGLNIAGSPTKWPGALASPIAMIDTGGGPVYLSDPHDYVCSSEWPEPVANPAWAAGSTVAQSIQAPIEITVGDETGSYSYIINNARFPVADQGITLVMSQQSSFMMGQQGMNVGGISALANAILVDYKNRKVGFRRR
jgi:hypothetical protein